jgi:AmiR/NasT family two-component response regulator
MLNKPFTQSAVYTTVMMAHGLKRRIAELESAAERGDTMLRMRPLVARTVARLMVENGIDEQQAFERLRALSMSANISIETICVDLENTPSAKGGTR